MNDGEFNKLLIETHANTARILERMNAVDEHLERLNGQVDEHAVAIRDLEDIETRRSAAEAAKKGWREVILTRANIAAGIIAGICAVVVAYIA